MMSLSDESATTEDRRSHLGLPGHKFQKESDAIGEAADASGDDAFRN